MAFLFKLLLEDGTPAEPPTLDTAVPTWRAGGHDPLGRGRMKRVIEVRPAERRRRPEGASRRAGERRGAGYGVRKGMMFTFSAQ
jgi:hypothetical protein